jgi:hypothetical protein
VKRGKNQVTGQRCANCNLRCLEVTNFSYHDDVRIGPQNRAESIGKGETDFRFHRDLHHTREFVFHRIFDGDDAAVRLIELGEEGVERGRFAAAGGTDEGEGLTRFDDEIDVAKGALTGTFELGLEDTGSRMTRNGALLCVRGEIVPVDEQVRRWLGVDQAATRRAIERVYTADPIVVTLGPG